MEQIKNNIEWVGATLVAQEEAKASPTQFQMEKGLNFKHSICKNFKVRRFRHFSSL